MMRTRTGPNGLEIQMTTRLMCFRNHSTSRVGSRDSMCKLQYLHLLRLVFVHSFILTATCFGFSGITHADEAADAAKQLSNPLAALISVPFQFNYNQGYGTANGDQVLLNIQPVIPISLNEEWNLISRTILPIVYQNNVAGLSGDQFGLGNISQSLWLSPSRPTSSGLTWGIGSILVLPTRTDPLLGPNVWGSGPTAVALVQKGPWTIGGLVNHVWSFGSNTINSTFLQPFMSYTTPTAWTYGLNTESTYNWTTNQWSVPINGSISKLVNIDGQLVSLSGGVRYYAVSTTGGPSGWGARLGTTFLFPTK